MSRDRAQGAASASSAAFVIGAAVVGAASVASPFERGRRLTAYLFLVGGLAQLRWCAARRRSRATPHHPSALLVWAQWGLWNLGTAGRVVADMAQVMAAVDVGSVVRLVALVLYHLGSAPRGDARPTRFRARGGYTALLVVLGSCVLLAPSLPALPGQ